MAKPLRHCSGVVAIGPTRVCPARGAAANDRRYSRRMGAAAGCRCGRGGIAARLHPGGRLVSIVGPRRIYYALAMARRALMLRSENTNQESCSMAARQIRRPTKKATPTARKAPARRTAAKPKAAVSASKPASMTGPLPPIVTLKHLAEWAGYNHDLPKKQATAMLTDFVDDIGRVLKKGSKI